METINVAVDVTLHANMSKIVKENQIDYPSIKFYTNRAIRNQLRIDMIKSEEQKIK